LAVWSLPQEILPVPLSTRDYQTYLTTARRSSFMSPKYDKINSIYSDGDDELLVADVVVTVLVELIEDSCYLPGCHENAKLREHLLEL
jgi:hypothetical protein